MSDCAQTTEVWRPVVGYEGLYEVSDHGRVRSLGGHGSTCSRWKNYRGALKRLTLWGGYMYATLRKDGKDRSARVHHLVAAAFIGPRPPGAMVCHWNDDGTDNRLANLRYSDERGNASDRIRNGRLPTRSTGHKHAKLSEAQVIEIAASTDSYDSLVAKYDISKGHISWIKNHSPHGVRSVVAPARRSECRNGHSMEHRYVGPSGIRCCAICLAARAKRYRTRLKQRSAAS